MKNDIKLVLVDYHQLFREGVKKVLEKDPQFDIIASTDDYSVLNYVLEANDIDAVLLDAKIFKEHQDNIKELILETNIKIILLGAESEPTNVQDAIVVGVHGYLFKEMDMFSFVDAIKQITDGHSYYHPTITSDLVNEYRKIILKEYQQKDPNEVKRPLHLYTKRECEVLQLLTDGQSNRHIAETLNISEKTVKNHVSSLFKKMQVHDRTQAVVKAIRNNWVEL